MVFSKVFCAETAFTLDHTGINRLAQKHGSVWMHVSLQLGIVCVVLCQGGAQPFPSHQDYLRMAQSETKLDAPLTHCQGITKICQDAMFVEVWNQWIENLRSPIFPCLPQTFAVLLPSQPRSNINRTMTLDSLLLADQVRLPEAKFWNGPSLIEKPSRVGLQKTNRKNLGEAL